jgi:hypothetical protein
MMKMMNSKREQFFCITILALVFSLFASPGSWALARANAQSTKDAKEETVTVTGCLVKGDEEASRILITGQDGKPYLIKNADDGLKNHIGHKVAVTGRVTEIDDDEAGEEYREGGAMLLVVTSFKLISTKCP